MQLFEKIEPYLVRVIDTLGSTEFYPSFFNLVRQLAVIDQFMVFEFCDSGAEVICRLAHNAKKPELGMELARRYVDGGYLDDPLLKQLQQDARQGQAAVTCALLSKRSLPPVYRRTFFNVPDLDVKFSFVVTDSYTGHLFYINFYSQQSAELEREIQADLEKLRHLIGRLLVKHFRDEHPSKGTLLRLEVSGLSHREAEICGLMLKGHTAKSIALRLGLSEATIITYKRRAYEKLQIKRKSELVKFL